ncbi:MAG: endonuclease III [Verrucomicrobiota bacterium]
MRRQERADLIGTMLDEIYPEVPVPLDHVDPFTLLIAVLLSAQCTDKRVNLVTPALFKRAGSPEAMAKLSVAEIQEFIQTCGLAPQKAKAIKKTAEILRDEFNGMVPQSFEELERLPGVGHKTASVVMAQAFGVPAFPVDTHIHRLAKKWRLSRARNVTETEKDLKKIFLPETWNKRHLQIIFYGREYSPARGKKNESDPITLEIAARSKKTPG